MQKLDTSRLGLAVEVLQQMNNGYLKDKLSEIPEQDMRIKLDESNGRLVYYSFYANYKALPWFPPEGVKFAQWNFDFIKQYVADKIRQDFFQLFCQYNHPFEMAPITLYYELNVNNELIFMSRIDTYHEKESPLIDRKITHEDPPIGESLPLTIDPDGRIQLNAEPQTPVISEKKISKRKAKKKV